MNPILCARNHFHDQKDQGKIALDSVVPFEFLAAMIPSSHAAAILIKIRPFGIIPNSAYIAMIHSAQSTDAFFDPEREWLRQHVVVNGDGTTVVGDAEAAAAFNSLDEPQNQGNFHDGQDEHVNNGDYNSFEGPWSGGV
jgi:hypothetical protein